MENTVSHAAERAAFSLVLDGIEKYTKKERTKGYVQLVNMMQKVLGNVWKPETYDHLREGLGKDGKWSRYLDNLIDTIDPHVLHTIVLNTAYEGAIHGYRETQKKGKELGCHIPWVILFDPTSACNLHCTGCWAAEYGNRLNLSYEDIDSIVTQGKALGIRSYVMTGGEPMVRKADIIRLCEKHSDCSFLAFTNGTLVDDALCRDMKRVGNLMLALSVEGFAEATDSRRGKGTFDRVMAAMDLLHSYGLIYGTSICYTSVNYKDVTSDAFLDLLISKGNLYSWYFHYMPVGNDASVNLMLNPEQREYMYNRIREIRGWHGGKPIFAIDFQNDGEYVGGCVAGGKYYCHINPNGDVEPCVFIHYSSANIHDKTLLECLRQPLFTAYQAAQPFNKNLLQPCPMLENPDKLRELVKATGAVSTDLQSPESCDHLCGKCDHYAAEWSPEAQKLWATTHPQK